MAAMADAVLAWWPTLSIAAAVVACLVLAWLNVRQSAAFAKGREAVVGALVSKYPTGGVALVTGANSGVGLQVVHDLAALGWHVVMGCRNPDRAAAAVAAVRAATPAAKLDTLRVDVASMASVQAAASEFTSRFGRLDVLFCNAGVLPSAGFRAAVVLRAMFGCSMAHFYETSRASPQGDAFIRNPPNEVTPEGFGRLFATHVLGHLLLVHQLLPTLRAHKGRVVWTGSRSASDAPQVFDMSDIQHINGREEAYGSSKYIVDLVNAGLNDLFARANVTDVSSFAACPGAFSSGAAPPAFRALAPLLKVLRPVQPKSFHVTTDRAALALLALAAVEPRAIDKRKKHCVEDGLLMPCKRGSPPCPQRRAQAVLRYCLGVLDEWHMASNGSRLPDMAASRA